jgi:hypothetical protein
VSVTYIIVGVLVLALSLVTDYSLGPDRQTVSFDDERDFRRTAR